MPAKPKCLCQLCSCGRHRCPRNCAMLVESKQPPDNSEYRNTYIRKDFQPVKPCKPDEQLHLVCEPLSNRTLYREDYIRLPLAQKVVHKVDPYYPTGDPFDGTTNYRTEFIQKQIEPAKPAEKKKRLICLAPFNGQTSNKTDYIRLPLSYERVKKKEEYRPLDCAFDGNSMYRTSFITHPNAMRESMKPSAFPMLADAPLETRTEHKDQFIRHPLPEKMVQKKQDYFPLDCPSIDTTMYRQEFIRKPYEPTKSFKPDYKPNLCCEPLDKNTITRTDYIRWNLEKPYKHNREPYHPPDGQITSDTTHRVEFTRKPLTTIKVVPQKETRKCIAAPFDGRSTYKNEFIRFPLESRSKREPEPYHPLDEPFNGRTSYKTDFIRMPNATRESMKPNTTAFLSREPLQTGTEYKKEFIHKDPLPCVAGMIQSGMDTGMSFVQQDAACHKWYQETQCAA